MQQCEGRIFPANDCTPTDMMAVVEEEQKEGQANVTCAMAGNALPKQNEISVIICNFRWHIKGTTCAE